MKNYQAVSFQAAGKYSLLGNLNKQTKNVLFVLHGQGQLAKYFIKKFTLLQSQGFIIIAPEALHLYYLQGFTGRVGASWMTSENRLVTIQNYISFLNSVYNDVSAKISNETKIHLLGFSQGAATVSRWVEQSNFDFEQLILWGGALPTDLAAKKITKRLTGKKFTHVIGKQDSYITADKISEIKKLVSGYGLESEYIMYDGGHDIDKKTLLNLFN